MVSKNIPDSAKLIKGVGEYKQLKDWATASNSFIEKFKNIVLSSRSSVIKDRNRTNSDFLTNEFEILKKDSDKEKDKFYSDHEKIKSELENMMSREKDDVDYSKLDDKECVIEIYFQRKNSNVKVLIEKWIMSLTSDQGGGVKIDKNKSSSNLVNISKHIINTNNPSNSNVYKTSYSNVNSLRKFREIFSLKKLSTFIRTIYIYTKILPAFTIFSSNGFDYNLDYKFYFTKISHHNLSGTYEYLSNFLKLKKHFKNKCDINVGIITLEVQYVDKNEVFLFEQEIKMQLQKSNEVLFNPLVGNSSRQRFYSQRTVTGVNLEKTSNLIKKIYGIQDKNESVLLLSEETDDCLNLRKVNSKSLDKYQPKGDGDGFTNYSNLSLNQNNEFNEYNDFLGDKKEINNFDEFIILDLEKERSEITQLTSKIYFIKEREYETLCDSIEESFLYSGNNNYNGDYQDYTDYSDYDYDEEDEELLNLQCAEEILEISDDSQNFYLHEEIPNNNNNNNLIKDYKNKEEVSSIFLTLKKLKVEIKAMSRININLINLYKCVNKN